MGKGKDKDKGKTSGNGYINGSVNNGGGYVEAGGSVTHKPGPNTEIKVEGNINRTQPSHGKGQTGGGGKISITHDF